MQPVSSFDQKFQNCRQDTSWSERVIRRRQAFAQSDSGSSETKQSLPPPPESLLPNPPSKTNVTKKCSTCSCQKSTSTLKNRNESRSSVRGKAEDKKVKSSQLEQLEVDLYNAELEDAAQSEKCKQTRERLNRVLELLQAQTMYLQSLDLRARALDRLSQLTGKFAYKDLNPTETLSQALDTMGWDANLMESLSELQSVTTAAAQTPEQVYQLQEELRDKQQDYQTASKNFSQYLRSVSRVPTSYLRKLESQYKTIKSKCESSRQMLDREYPKLIDERQNVLQHCFSKLVPLQETVIEQDKQFLILSKEISKILQEPSKRHSCRQICGDKCYSKHLFS